MHAEYPPRKFCHTQKCPNSWDHSVGPQVSSHWVVYICCLNVIAVWLSWPNQPITTEWSLQPEIVNLIFRLWGTPVVDILLKSTTHIFPSLSLHFRSTGDRCPVTGLAGEVNVHVSTISPAQHLYYICVWTTHASCVWTTHASFRTTETCCHNRGIS